ncbi:MAG TPA: hypothetical protein VH374_04860 [Polyangia bacterium]|jgi:hypothetical protein|nr:hypothetical protein [Polyangia bacterium]
MPIRKFRDVSEMPAPDRTDPKDPQLWRRVTRWMALSLRLARRRWPPGVYRNRTIEEANLRREGWQSQSRQSR